MSARSVYEKRKQTKRNRLHGWQFFKKEIKEKTNSGCKTLSTTKKKKEEEKQRKGKHKAAFFFVVVVVVVIAFIFTAAFCQTPAAGIELSPQPR